MTVSAASRVAMGIQPAWGGGRGRPAVRPRVGDGMFGNERVGGGVAVRVSGPGALCSGGYCPLGPGVNSVYRALDCRVMTWGVGRVIRGSVDALRPYPEGVAV